VPVVGAPSGLALGGGFEVLMHTDKLVMHANSVVGLVESAVGLVPGGGGVKETYLRWYQHTGDWSEAAWKAWMNIGYGATASSPELAIPMQYFIADNDIALMNRDRLFTRSISELDAMQNGYCAKPEPKFRLAGGDILERMAAFMDKGISRGDFFPHDKTVAMGIASIICSADGVECDASEQTLYDNERAAFIKLAQTPQTHERISAMLSGRGAVRN